MAIQKGEVLAYSESIPNLKDLKDRDHATPPGDLNRPWNFLHVPFTTHSLPTHSLNDTHSLSPTRTHTYPHAFALIHSLTATPSGGIGHRSGCYDGRGSYSLSLKTRSRNHTHTHSHSFIQPLSITLTHPLSLSLI